MQVTHASYRTHVNMVPVLEHPEPASDENFWQVDISWRGQKQT